MSREQSSPTSEQLFEHTAFLTRLARQLVGDEHRAEDLVQDAFALALERPPRAAHSLRGWLAVVVSNLARNERRGTERRQARERVRARAERLEPDELALETLEVQRALIELVVALPEEQRTVLYLRYYEDLTPTAIAQRLAVPVKTVKARHTRGLAELRARLDTRDRGEHEQGARKAWSSALLPTIGQGSPARARPWFPRSFVDARWAKLALGLAAALVAVLAWSVQERSRPGSRDVETALRAPVSAPTPGPSRGTSSAPARALVVPAREATPATSGTLEEPAAQVTEPTLVLEVDRDRVRALSWSREGASDEQVLEAAAGIVKRRCRSMGRAVRLRVEVERGRIEVVLPAAGARERELVQGVLSDLGLCELLIVADEVSLAGLDVDLAAENQKLARWRAENPELPLAAFNVLAPAEQGPHPRLTWVRSSFGGTFGPEVPLLLPARLGDHLGATSFARFVPEPDAFGYPSLWCEVLPARRSDLARLTEAHAGQRLAVVIGDELRSAPRLDQTWIGGGSLEGRFRDEELERLAESFRRLDGPLRIVDSR